MSVDAIRAGGDFRVGDVLSRAWRLFTGSLAFFLLVPLVLSLVLSIAGVIFVMLFVFAGWASGSILIMGVGAVLALLVVPSLTMVGQGVLLLGAFQRLRGEVLRLSEVLQRVFARFMPLLGLSILWSLALILVTFLAAFVFGAVASVLGGWTIVLTPLVYVPSSILAVMWAVVVPACIVEDLGPVASMGRSAQLTKGFRWKIFGIGLLFLLMFVAAVIMQIILGTFSQALAGIYGIIWFLVWIAYGNCTIIMTYHDLRVAKEGVDTQQIASIFD
jgi:hypothetical protein